MCLYASVCYTTCDILDRERSMSQTALAVARNFSGWLRLPVSKTRTLLFTGIDIERELWTALEYYSEVEDIGLNLIQTKGLQPQSLHQEIFKCFQAFVRQAKAYYGSAKTLHYRSSSLLYYYSFLNLVKAYLLFQDPQKIMGRTKQSVTHGLNYKTNTTNTDFQLEVIRVSEGIFPLFYEAETSIAISTARTSTLNITSLLSYPIDIGYPYQLVGYGDHKILPSLAAGVIDQTQKQAWTIIGIPAHPSLNNFLNLHVNFLNSFQEVEINKNLLATTMFAGIGVPELSFYRFFQNRTTIPLLADDFIPIPALMEHISNALHPYFSVHYFDDNKDFDLILPYHDSTNTAPIPMNEALSIYAVMFYLSSLVRYRPNYLESLLNHKPAWLIENFVNGTPETFLRMMVSKITEKDFVFQRR